jgi:hypothetical protein
MNLNCVVTRVQFPAMLVETKWGRPVGSETTPDTKGRTPSMPTQESSLTPVSCSTPASAVRVA